MVFLYGEIPSIFNTTSAYLEGYIFRSLGKLSYVSTTLSSSLPRLSCSSASLYHFEFPFTEQDQVKMVLDPRYRDVDRTTEDCHQRVLGMLSEVSQHSRIFF